MGAPCRWYVICQNPLSQLQRSTQPQLLARSSSVDQGLEQTLASGTFDELAVQRLLASAQPAAAVTVPETLRGYEVESVSAAVYDRLLAAAAP